MQAQQSKPTHGKPSRTNPPTASPAEQTHPRQAQQSKPTHPRILKKKKKKKPTENQKWNLPTVPRSRRCRDHRENQSETV